MQRHGLDKLTIAPKTIPVMEGVETSSQFFATSILMPSEDYPRYGGG